MVLNSVNFFLSVKVFISPSNLNDILFQVGCLFRLCLFGLVGFYLAPSSVTYFFVISFLFLMGGAVFPSYWLFGLRRPVLEFAGSWIELGLGAEMRTSGRPHSD